MKTWVLFTFASAALAQAPRSDQGRAFQPVATAVGWRDEMLRAHNAERARVGVNFLTWSDRLALRAQAWADALIARHAFKHSANSEFGENLFEVVGARASATQVVRAWASESRDYDYKTNRCRGTCGHYTQIVWSTTREVGCGVARDARREVWVCSYDPPGNWVGKRPY